MGEWRHGRDGTLDARAGWGAAMKEGVIFIVDSKDCYKGSWELNERADKIMFAVKC